ncbi:ethanolamine permease [Fulvivirga sediminis]|uniref:Ethanolamine permease n=1 Tax=Fulvivirga sediminis TaxID=2803949 RepID=A0A937F483_9BACT|nr:ethanolamine permease [Fulvivirga sediminis]MBL3656061.1 ethanolamine permease [Fulvivirga sediminis]
MNDKSEEPGLRKVLRPVHLWAIAVGLVISGEYFGWNYGWGVSGTVGFLIATLIVTLMYVTFIFSFTELTSSIPHAGGPFAYSYRAFGFMGGFIAGYATLIEFLFAPPAIALALSSYLHFLHPAIPILPTAILCFVVFTGVNLLGIKESAVFSLIVTLLAVAELMLYMGLVAPDFEINTFMSEPMPFGWSGVFAALPFAIWFYLAIEGVAMVAEEVEDPKKNIPKGYIYSLITLVLLALGVMLLTGGVTSWRNLSDIDYPLPEALSVVLGKDNSWTKLFASIGLFGLIASFHGIIIGYSRQLFALARAGYLPSFLGKVNQKFRTPHWALVAGGVVGCLALLSGTTDQVIIMSVLGALVMYVISMVSLFVLRKKEPDLERPFKAPFYPLFPAIALLLCCVSLGAIIWYNPFLSLIFFLSLIVIMIVYVVLGKHKNKIKADLLLEKEI